MTQFAIYRLADDMLVVDLQADVLDIGTHVVAPLTPVTEMRPALRHLEPVFEIGGTPHALRAADMAAVPAKLLRTEPVGDLRAQDYAIRRARDMVFSGF